jgi:subfamily B ATP-binding cassette protein MsbA
MNYFVRILQYLRKYNALVALSIGSNLVSVLFSLVSLTMVIPFLQLLFDKNISTATPIPVVPSFHLSVQYIIGLFNHYFIKIIVSQGKIQALFFICLLVVGIFFVKNLFRYLALFFLAPVRNGVVKDIYVNSGGVVKKSS